jgi:ATP dependent DNA ligase domain
LIDIDRNARADRYRADMDVAEIDVPAVGTFGVAAAGEVGHGAIEARPPSIRASAAKRGSIRAFLAVADHPIMKVRRPSGFIALCLPSKAGRQPSGPLWVHEIKHDGYRLLVRRDGGRIRCFTRNGHDWADLFPAIVDAALCLKAARGHEAVLQVLLARAGGHRVKAVHRRISGALR